MNPFPDVKAGAILADPPWRFNVRSEKGESRSASRHYRTMKLEEIQALPVREIAADDCALFMWGIDPMLPQLIQTAEAWGFEFKTVAFYWVKTNKVKKPGVFPGYFTGMGYWTRANPEICILATRGKPKRLSKGVKRLIVAERRDHSRKPDCIYSRIERLVAGPYVELFSRTTAPGWIAWGDQVGKFTLETKSVVS